MKALQEAFSSVWTENLGKREYMFQKLERKFGRYAIHGLMRYVIILYAVGFVLYSINPLFYYEYLMLDIDKVLQGQVWRFVTFLIQPIDDDLFFLFFSLYLYYMIGNSLEQRWGSFRFNLYYFSGIVFNVLAVVIIYVTTYLLFGEGISYPISLRYLNLSLFLAFAVEFSEVRLLLFFVIPIKIKYLAIIYAILEGYTIVTSIMDGSVFGICAAAACVTAMMNFLVFFFSTRNYRRISPEQFKRKRAYRQSVRQGQSFGHAANYQGKTVITRHRCAVCGRTELDGDDLEFRFCSKCDGNYEYCMDHLYTHTHVVREKKDEKSE